MGQRWSRAHLVPVPVPFSWLNLVGIFFSIVERKVCTQRWDGHLFLVAVNHLLPSCVVGLSKSDAVADLGLSLERSQLDQWFKLGGTKAVMVEA